MLPLSLFPMVVLALRAAPAGGAAAPLTFQDTDPITGGAVVCDQCPPGTYLRARCTSASESECAPCPPGSFTELWNYIPRCLRCGVCGHNQVVKAACSVYSDCQCECKPGYYYKKKYDMCVRHSECQPGQEVLTKGTADEDTVCRACPNGTYSDTASAHRNCTAHTSCGAAGLELVLRGSAWHDSVCASCEGLRSRDGADYLKEILPAFFGHQKMPARRLRRLLHKLPSEGANKPGGTPGPHLSDLHARIHAWVASATAEQLRHLPGTLMKAGANCAGERLATKLRRIDAHRNELCSLGNEVDVVLMSE